MTGIYTYGFFILAGIIMGIFIALKWLAPAGTEVKVGKFVIRGRDNVVTDVSDINVSERELKREARKKRRAERQK